jgi:hypothetical protein
MRAVGPIDLSLEKLVEGVLLGATDMHGEVLDGNATPWVILDGELLDLHPDILWWSQKINHLKHICQFVVSPLTFSL